MASGAWIDYWEEPQSERRQIFLWRLVAGWVRALVPGGITVCVAKACSIHQKFRIGEEANHGATGPLSSPRPTQSRQNLPTSLPTFCCNEVTGQGPLQHSVPTAARQLVNLTFFMGNFDVCSPLSSRKAGVHHFNFVLGKKHCILHQL